MSDTFVGFPDPTAVPPPGHKRGVEYGTAIVVTSFGDLIALGEVTDDCQSITVPGFGHADRIAADQADDLALLRLYGARDLVAAPLGGDGSGADLTLFGFPDPPAQPGGGAVTSAAAELTTQGIAPRRNPALPARRPSTAKAASPASSNCNRRSAPARLRRAASDAGASGGGTLFSRRSGHRSCRSDATLPDG